MTLRFRATLFACLVAALGGPTRLRAQAVPTGTILNFAHFANGDTGKGVWTTDFAFVNNSSATATGRLSLFDDNGAPFALATNQGTASMFNIMIAPGGEFDIVTNGAGAVVGGYGVANFDHAVIGSATYALSTTAGGQVVSVGVLSANPGNSFRSPATLGIGIAIVNLSASTTNTITLEALDQKGNVAGSVNLMLAPMHHMANNLNVLIPTLASTFAGSVSLSGSNDNMIALAIGVKTNTNGFVSWSLPALGYVKLPSSLVGNYTFTSGPDAPASGALTITDIEAFGRGLYTGTINITFMGTTYSGPVFASSDPFGLLISFYFKVLIYARPGRGLAPLPTSGTTFSGYAVDFGTGDAGTFTLSPGP